MASSPSTRLNFHVYSIFFIILLATLIISCGSEGTLGPTTNNNIEDLLFGSETEESNKDLEELGNEVTVEEFIHPQKEKDFYSFYVYDIDGNLVSLEKYRGKVVLVVNVASACGFTDGHYKGLIRMKNILSHTNKFEILAFPCNQFGAQEPGTNAEIKEWIQENYHANFPLFSKINVLDDNVPEAWQYLINKTGKAPNWNFWKYLVTDQGHAVDAWGPRVPVEDLFHLIKRHVDVTPPVPESVSQEMEENIAYEHGEL